MCVRAGALTPGHGTVTHSAVSLSAESQVQHLEEKQTEVYQRRSQTEVYPSAFCN